MIDSAYLYCNNDKMGILLTCLPPCKISFFHVMMRHNLNVKDIKLEDLVGSRVPSNFHFRRSFVPHNISRQGPIRRFPLLSPLSFIPPSSQ